MKIVKKVRAIKTGYWLTIESRKLKKLFSHMVSSSIDKNIKICLLTDIKFFKVIFNEKAI